jgi:hypothetical protein
MNHTSPTYKNASTNHTTDQSTTSRTTNTTEHYSRSTNTSEEPRTTATRSTDSHRCITIRRRVALGRAARPEIAHQSLPMILGLTSRGWFRC